MVYQVIDMLRFSKATEIRILCANLWSIRKVGNAKLENFAVLVWKMNVEKSRDFIQDYYGNYADVTGESYGDKIEIHYFQKKRKELWHQGKWLRLSIDHGVKKGGKNFVNKVKGTKWIQSILEPMFI